MRIINQVINKSANDALPKRGMRIPELARKRAALLVVAVLRGHLHLRLDIGDDLGEETRRRGDDDLCAYKFLRMRDGT